MADLITHDYLGFLIKQRVDDGYLNATVLCRAATQHSGRHANYCNFEDYYRLESTCAFLEVLSTETEIPKYRLVQKITEGVNVCVDYIWVHPYVAIHLAHWLGANFEVWVMKKVFAWIENSRKLADMAKTKEETKAEYIEQYLVYEHGNQIQLLKDRVAAIENQIRSVETSSDRYYTLSEYLSKCGISLGITEHFDLDNKVNKYCNKNKILTKIDHDYRIVYFPEYVLKKFV